MENIGCGITEFQRVEYTSLARENMDYHKLKEKRLNIKYVRNLYLSFLVRTTDLVHFLHV